MTRNSGTPDNASGGPDRDTEVSRVLARPGSQDSRPQRRLELLIAAAVGMVVLLIGALWVLHPGTRVGDDTTTDAVSDQSRGGGSPDDGSSRDSGDQTAAGGDSSSGRGSSASAGDADETAGADADEGAPSDTGDGSGTPSAPSDEGGNGGDSGNGDGDATEDGATEDGGQVAGGRGPRGTEASGDVHTATAISAVTPLNNPQVFTYHLEVCGSFGNQFCVGATEVPGSPFTLTGGTFKKFPQNSLSIGVLYRLRQAAPPPGWHLSYGCSGTPIRAPAPDGNGELFGFGEIQPDPWIDCTFHNTADPGAVHVVKHTTPAGGSGPFPFRLQGPNGYDQSGQVASDDGSFTFNAVPANAPYSLTESLTGLPYTLGSINCGAGINPASFTVPAGTTVNCTVTNVHTGSVTVTKTTNPAGGTGPFPVTLHGPNQFTQNSSIPSHNAQTTFTNIPAGPGYSLTENLAGLPYSLGSISCGSAGTGANFSVPAGGNVACTVTNNANPGSVTVTKGTLPAGGTGPFPLTVSGPNQFSQTMPVAGDGASVTFTNVPAAAGYQLTENLNGLPYTLSSIDCGAGNNSFTMPAGGHVTCHVTNVAVAGTLTVKKVTNPSGGTGTFPVRLTGPVGYNQIQSIAADGGQVVFTNIPPHGTGYALNEELPVNSPYALGGIDCGAAGPNTNINIGPGANVTCTVTNNAKPGQVVVHKVTTPAGGSGPFPVTVKNGPSQFDKTMSVPAHGAQVTFTDVPAGSGYDLEEDLTGLPYTLTGIDCGSAGPANHFTVPPAGTVSCTVTNALHPAKMTFDVKADPTSAPVNSPIKFKLVVENTGPVALATLAITNDLPSSLTFVKATPSSGTCTGTTTLTCQMGNTAIGAKATVDVKAKIKPSASGSITNDATATATAPPDPQIEDSGRAKVQVMSSPTTTTTSTTTTSPTSTTTSSSSATTAAGGGTSGGSTSGGTSASGVLPVTGSWPAMLAKSAAWLIGLGSLAWLGARRWKKRRELSLE